MNILTNVTGNFKNIFSKASFAKNAFIVMVGTIASQALLFLASPILTRIYDPHAFGIYSTFVAITAVGSVIVTGKYDMAVILPEDDSEARALFAFGSILVLSTCFVLFIIILLFHRYIQYFFILETHLLYLIPLSVNFMGLSEFFKNWLIRKSNFKYHSISIAGHSLLTISFQLILGYFILNNNNSGLVFGQVISQLIVLAFLIFLIGGYLFKQNVQSFHDLFRVAKRYIDFPKHMILAGLLNRGTTYIPVFVLGWFYSPVIVGYYALAQYAIKTPMTVIGGGVSTAFIQKSNELAQKGRHYLKIKSINLSLSLFLVGLVPVTLLLFSGPFFFALFFGNDWRVAGEFSQIMSLYLLAQFALSPLCILFRVLERQFLYSFWEWSRFILCAIGIGSGAYFFSPSGAIFMFSLAMVISYLLLGIFCWYILTH